MQVRKFMSLWVICLATICQAQEAVREWSDSTGSFRVQATLVGVKDGKVTLKLANGKLAAVPIERLSESDRAYLRDQESPFQMLGDSNETASTPVTFSDIQKRWAQPKTIDWNTVPKIATRQRVGWNVPVVDNRLGIDVKKIMLKKTPAEKPSSVIAINPIARRCVVSFDTANSTRVSLVDLVSGRSINPSAGSSKVSVSALLGNGSDILVAPKKDQLQVWSLQGNSLQQSPSWIPYANDSKRFGRTANSDVTMLRTVGTDRMVTVSNLGHVVFWNVADREPIWHSRMSELNYACDVSRDGKLIALYDQDMLSVVDSESGTVIGSASQKGKRVGWCRLRWSPSGKRLLYVAVGDLRVLDVETGEWIYDFTFSEPKVTRVVYVDDDYVVVDEVLVHLPSKIKVCKYEGFGQSTSGGVTVIVSDLGNQAQLQAFPVPHPEAVAKQKQAEADPSLFLIHPGVKVALDVSGVPAPYQNSAREGLTKSIAASGYELVSDAPIKVVASVSGPKPDVVTYFGHGSCNVQEYWSGIKLQWQDKELQARGASNIPFMLELGRGESIQQKLNELSKQPNLSIFDSIRFPKMMQAPSAAGGALMRAKFTAQGIVNENS